MCSRFLDFLLPLPINNDHSLSDDVNKWTTVQLYCRSSGLLGKKLGHFTVVSIGVTNEVSSSRYLSRYILTFTVHQNEAALPRKILREKDNS